MEATVRKNPKLWMLTAYLFLVAAFLYTKPSISFGREGQIRPFGVKNKDSTIFPVWWWMFIFAVLSYLGVAYLLKFDF